LQDAGIIVLVEVAARNVEQAKKALNARSVFLLPPTLGELEDRIRSSGIEDEALIREMVAQTRADSEYTQTADEWVFEHFVMNTALVKALWRVEDFLTEQ
jgi:guanylate kinase